MIAGPFGLGRGLVWLGSLASRKPIGIAILNVLGRKPHSSAWQAMWTAPLETGAAVVVQVHGGKTVYGQVDSGAVIDFSPLPPAIYLAVAYRKENDEFIAMDGGAYIPGDQISTVYLADLTQESATAGA